PPDILRHDDGPGGHGVHERADVGTGVRAERVDEGAARAVTTLDRVHDRHVVGIRDPLVPRELADDHIAGRERVARVGAPQHGVPHEEMIGESFPLHAGDHGALALHRGPSSSDMPESKRHASGSACDAPVARLGWRSFSTRPGSRRQEKAMKAIRVHKFGGPEVLQLDDVADPKAGPGQVLVEIKAAGVNPVDTYVRSGNYAILPQLPYVPGADGAGVVKAVGDGVTRLRPGERVWVARQA